MITTKLQGGLGNQMFQYAAGRSLSIRLGAQFSLDGNWFVNESRRAITPRNFELSVFRLTDTFSEDLPHPRRQMLKSLIFPPEKLLESQAPDLSTLNKMSKNIYLDGYWNDYRIFVDQNDKILSDFTLSVPLSEESKDVLSKIKQGVSASIHVRRGDYITDAGSNAKHGVLPREYYETASSIIAKNNDAVHFYVFSDDIDWCRTNIKLKQKVTFVDHNTAERSYEDMYLMSQCSHNIIANSTFSWWGAWLNQNTDRQVVAPARWFNDDTQARDSLIPPEWSLV